MREIVPVRAAESHKGDFGRVLIIGGSLGRPGAAHLAALGALRSGAGLVTIATPRSCAPILASMAAEYMTLALDETPEGTIDFAALDRVLDFEADVIAVGPGLGTDPSTAAFLQGLVERAGVPLVLDADALNAFSGDPDRLVARDGVEMVITPHPGEMARLVGQTVETVQGDRLNVARDFAATHKVHVVLKGHRTIIAGPENRAFINLTGNAGMATGGTGDVLTGMLAASFAQLLDPRVGLPDCCVLRRPRRRSRRRRRRRSLTHGQRPGLEHQRCPSRVDDAEEGPLPRIVTETLTGSEEET